MANKTCMLPSFEFQHGVDRLFVWWQFKNQSINTRIHRREQNRLTFLRKEKDLKQTLCKPAWPAGIAGQNQERLISSSGLLKNCLAMVFCKAMVSLLLCRLICSKAYLSYGFLFSSLLPILNITINLNHFILF